MVHPLSISLHVERVYYIRERQVLCKCVNKKLLHDIQASACSAGDVVTWCTRGERMRGLMREALRQPMDLGQVRRALASKLPQ